jgi:hypothetical protein
MKPSVSVLCAVMVSVVGLAATLRAPHAFAIDFKVYPGTTCVKLAGGANITRDMGSIENRSPTAFLFIDCNVVNDVYLHITQGWIQTTDRHPSEDIGCNLVQVMRRYQDSAVVFWINGQHTAGAANNVQILHYGRADPNFTTGAASHNFYTCQIPPTYDGAVSQIHSYSVIEE